MPALQLDEAGPKRDYDKQKRVKIVSSTKRLLLILGDNLRNQARLTNELREKLLIRIASRPGEGTAVRWAVGSSQSHIDLLGMPVEGEWKKQAGTCGDAHIGP